MGFKENTLATVLAYKASLRNACLLIIAFFTSLTISQFIKVPFHNPYNISNPYNATGYSPDSNFYILFFVIVATITLFILLQRLYESKYAFLIKVLVIATLLVDYFLVQLVLTYGYTAPDGIIDNFHAGEQLSAATAFMSGVPLYDHMFFLRGAGVDAVIPAIGLGLLGKTIGSFIMTADSLELLAQLSFFTLLAFLIKNPLKFTAVAVLLYISNATSLVQFRDITVWIVIGLLFLVFKLGIGAQLRNAALVLIGLFSGLTLYISIDRGLLLSVLAAVLALLLPFLRIDKGNKYSLGIKSWKINSLVALYPFTGLISGVLIPAVFLGWGSFSTFIQMTFIDIPRYGGLLVSQPIPALFSDQLLFWAPVFVAGATGYLLYWLFRSTGSRQLNTLIPYSLIFIFAVLCLKAGSNRIHITKMASVTAPLYLIAIIVLFFATTYLLKYHRERAKILIPTALLATVLVTFSQLDFTKIMYTQNYTRAQIAAYKNIPKRSDDSWVAPETKKVKDYIISHTSKDDKIFAFTSNPMYYYLTDRQNASRFYVSWFADPQPYTNELLNELKQNKPKLIIYSDSSWMDAPDTVSMAVRIPEVNEWILKNYLNKQVMGNTVLLLKN